MKLKRILAGLLTGAMMITGIPALGLDGIGINPVYADDVPAEDGSSLTGTNIAKDKAVKVSGTDTVNTDATGDKAVDGDASTKWISADISKKTTQWLQIDLKEYRSSIDGVRISFADKAWTRTYRVKTSDTAKDDSWRLVYEKTRTDADETYTDEFTRNIKNEKMVFRRYVRFEFEGLNTNAGDDATGVAVSEIEIFGETSQEIYGPSITVKKPADGEYPKPAEVKANEQHAVHHTDLADRTTPAATLIKQNTGTREEESRTVGGNAQTPVTVPVWRNGEVQGELTQDQILIEDGTYGFNAKVQTPGTNNKFDVWGDDIKIVSFQLYLKKRPEGNGVVDIFGKSDKFAVQLKNDKLLTFMESSSPNYAWPEQAAVFGQDGIPAFDDQFINTWHDVLVVVDGKGKMRIYLDGKAGKTTQGADDGTHKPKEVPSKGLKPFTFSFNYADYANGDNTFDAQLARANERAFTTDYGYIARFKFYSNKNYAEMQNGAGTDISDANVLSDAFENFSIATLETDRTKDEVYSIITNMLQKEQPTARVSLCPYNRSTVWSKYDTDSNAWVDMAATEKFTDIATTKYRAKTTLDADDGFVFNEACKENVITNLTAEDASATTVKISEKDRRLEIVNYYNCEENDAAFPDEVCSIDELTLLDDDDDPDYDLDEIHMVYDADAQSQATKTIKEPEVKFSACTKHTDARVKISYAVTKGSEYADVNADTGVITPKKVSKLKIGYAPVTITVTASLVRTNDSGEEEAVTGANNQPVKASDTISIEIDTPPAQEDTVISTAPTITTKMPKTGDFPEVADVKMIYADAETASNSGEYHNDIADRMEPAATFDWLTEDYVNTLPDGSGAAGGYDTNKNQRPPQMPTVEEPSIVNIDGVWAFNGQAQTRGTENKFDVFGEDVKVISFKWYLKRWPTSGNKSIFGKGDKYAVQFTTDKLFMYMENRNGGWPQENFTVAAADKEAFLNKWHNVFMVVDGKGWQRLYVDGVASTTDTAGRPAQGQAFAAENPSQGRKPFSLGYNSSDTNQGTPNWWTQMFTKDDGYIADLQFYTNKHYYDMINGAGTDISSAHVMSDELAEYINIEDLEGNADYNGHLDAIITNLLQSENATVNISATPYTAKTIWKQKNASGQFEVVQRAQKFTALSEFQSIVTLTAHDGFKFADSVTTAAETNFNKSETGENRPTVSAELSADKKVLTVTAVYGATEDVDCTCAIKSFTLPQDQAAIALELEDGADATAEVTLADLNTAEDYSGIISTENCQNSHFNDPENRRYQFTYTLDTENSSENITFDPQTRKVTATKSGTAKIKVKATLQIKNAEGTFENVTNAAGDPAEKEAVITVTASRKNKPSSAEVTALNNAITTAERDFPAEVAEDYDSTKWQNLQTALTAAKGIDTTDAVSSAVTSATTNLTNAMDALKEADAKSEKGKAKDAVRSALTDAEVLYNAGNADQKYTEESWNKFKAAYEAADLTAEQMKEKTVAELNTLAEALKAAATEGPNGLVIKTTDPGKKDPVVSTVKDGDVLPGADGSQYQVASAKDKTVIITKGVDVKSVKVGPTVALKGEIYKVIGIGNSAFKGLKKATKVVIDANVTSIGDQAFANSKKLKNVTIGKDVTKIGKKAFFKCPKLNKVILKGNALTDKGIGGSAFKKTAKKASVKWGPVKGKARTKLKKKLKKAGLKVK